MPSLSSRLALALAVLSLPACGLTPSQKFGVAASMLIVGATIRTRARQRHADAAERADTLS